MRCTQGASSAGLGQSWAFSAGSQVLSVTPAGEHLGKWLRVQDGAWLTWVKAGGSGGDSAPTPVPGPALAALWGGSPLWSVAPAARFRPPPSLRTALCGSQGPSLQLIPFLLQHLLRGCRAASCRLLNGGLADTPCLALRTAGGRWAEPGAPDARPWAALPAPHASGWVQSRQGRL